MRKIREEKARINEKGEEKGFVCLNCKKEVFFSEFMGTRHRNHCPFCLFSRHVDLHVSGDRKACCGAEMMPIALTFKQEGKDKYGRKKQGEIMLVHECLGCGRISVNRIASDDSPEMIVEVFENSFKMGQEKREVLEKQRIKIVSEKEKKEISRQLFGTEDGV